jgi:hypothetical protein
MKITSIIPILAITRQRLGHLRQFPSRITGRDRSLQFLQIGFEKRVGDDQRLDRLASITAARRDSPSCSASELGLGADEDI